jgi:hypothetical protein
LAVFPEDSVDVDKNRVHSEDCTKMGDELTSTVVDRMRTVEISKIDSADVDENRDHLEDRTKMGDELNSQLVEKLHKEAIESHDQKVSEGGVLANATSDDVVWPLNVIKLGPFEAARTYFFAAEGPQTPRATQACFLSPELLSESVPAAPNISSRRCLPNTDGVKGVLTAGPNSIACMCVNTISPHISPAHSFLLPKLPRRRI